MVSAYGWHQTPCTNQTRRALCSHAAADVHAVTPAKPTTPRTEHAKLDVFSRHDLAHRSCFSGGDTRQAGEGTDPAGESFLVAGRPAFVLLPPEGRRAKRSPWFYAPTLPGLPDQHEKWMHERFLDAGVAVAGIDVGEAYGSPKGSELFTALYRELTARAASRRGPACWAAAAAACG